MFDSVDRKGDFKILVFLDSLGLYQIVLKLCVVRMKVILSVAFQYYHKFACSCERLF